MSGISHSLMPMAVEDAMEFEQRMPEAMGNLLRNEAYVNQVSDFVGNAYREALDSENAQQRRDAVETTHKYAKEALEAIADHVMNCAINFTDFLDCHDRALDDLVQQVDLIQHRVKSARQLEAIAADPSRINAVERPKQALGKPKIIVESNVSNLPRFDGWKIDYSQLDNVGTAPTETSSGSFLAVKRTTSRKFLGSQTTGRSTCSLASPSTSKTNIAPPGPPPSINAPGPPPSVLSPPGLPPTVADSSSSQIRAGTSRRFGGTSRRGVSRHARPTASTLLDQSDDAESVNSPSLTPQSNNFMPPPLPDTSAPSPPTPPPAPPAPPAL